MRRLVLVLVIAAFGAGCAPITASAHIERDIDFAGYATFDWGPADLLPVGDPRLDNNPFFRDYLLGSIERGMWARGFERATGDAPDLLVHYHASVSQKLEVNRLDRYSIYCDADYEPQIVEYEQGTLVIDIVDARTGKMIWRGWSQSEITGDIDHQDRLRQRVRDGVSRAMALLPAGGARADEVP